MFMLYLNITFSDGCIYKNYLLFLNRWFKMDKTEEVAGVFLPAKINKTDKKKSLGEREEGGGNSPQVKQHYS